MTFLQRAGFRIAFIRANVLLAAPLLLALPVGTVIALPDARSRATLLQEVTRKAENANPPQMRGLIVALGGDWTTEDTYEASDKASKPRREQARENYRAGPGGLSLIEEYHGADSAGQSWATGIFWWDDKAQGVRVLWCDSGAVGSGCRILSGIGKWEGHDFALTDVNGAAGKQAFTREVWSDLKRDSFTQTIYQGSAADKLERSLTIKATRKH